MECLGCEFLIADRAAEHLNRRERGIGPHAEISPRVVVVRAGDRLGGLVVGQFRDGDHVRVVGEALGDQPAAVDRLAVVAADEADRAAEHAAVGVDLLDGHVEALGVEPDGAGLPRPGDPDHKVTLGLGRPFGTERGGVVRPAGRDEEREGEEGRRASGSRESCGTHGCLEWNGWMNREGGPLGSAGWRGRGPAPSGH